MRVYFIGNYNTGIEIALNDPTRLVFCSAFIWKESKVQRRDFPMLTELVHGKGLNGAWLYLSNSVACLLQSLFPFSQEALTLLICTNLSQPASFLPLFAQSLAGQRDWQHACAV